MKEKKTHVLCSTAVLGFSVCCLSPGCKAPEPQQAEPVSQNAQVAQEAPSEPEVQMKLLDFPIVADAWKYSFRESDRSEYKKAAQILNDALNTEFSVDDNVSGLHYGDWYIIKKAGPEVPDGLLDAPRSRNIAYLVHLSDKKIITKDNISDALALYKSIEQAAKKPDISDAALEKIAAGLAAATSSIMFHHSEYLEESYVKELSAPKFEFGENTQFIYYITGTGMMKSAVRCTVVIYDDKVEVSVEPVMY